MTIKKATVGLGLVVVSTLLVGCSYPHNDAVVTSQGTLTHQQQLERQLKLAQANVVFTQKKLAKAKGELSELGQNLLVQKLAKCHVQVVMVGQTVRIIMPSALLFDANSANVKDSYVNHIMPMVAKLIRHYSKVNVAVTAYLASRENQVYAKALTDRQAQVVASELWAQHINVRLLYTKGHSDQEAISTNETPQGRYANNRVEINFRYEVPGVL